MQVCTTVINHVSLSTYRRGGEGKKKKGIEREEERREGRGGGGGGRRGRERIGEEDSKKRDYYERWEMTIVHGSVQHSWKLLISDMRKVAISAT